MPGQDCKKNVHFWLCDNWTEKRRKPMWEQPGDVRLLGMAP